VHFGFEANAKQSKSGSSDEELPFPPFLLPDQD
jgi:hypothetical protein